MLGNGSNLLVADGEHDVIGVHLDGEFAELTTRDEGEVVVVDGGRRTRPADRGAAPGQVGCRGLRMGRRACPGPSGVRWS